MEIIIIVGLILLNGIFSMSEIAVISARKSKLNSEIKKGNKNAQTALRLAENPDSFLSTVQVGITLIGILTGIYSGDVLAADFSVFLVKSGVAQPHSYAIAQTVIIITVTFFTIILGELVPKRIGISFAETIAQIIAKPMLILSKIVRPFVWLLSKCTSFIFNLFGFKNTDSVVTEEEIKSMLEESREDGEIRKIEQDIVERVFGLGDRTLESIMTRRSEIVSIDVNSERENIIDIINSHPYSKYPAVSKNLDNIEGIIYLKDIFGKVSDKYFDISQYIKPAIYLSGTMKVYDALEDMKNKKINQAFIIDEYGTLLGLVSLTDIMEALVGYIPEYQENFEIIQRKDGSYLVDAQISFYDFLEYFNKEDLFAENSYNTISGLILDLLKNMPKTGDIVNWKSFSFEIVDMDGLKIDKVLIINT